MKRAANIRVRPGGMDRLRQIAGEFGATSRSGINAGEASVSELLDRVVSGELVIVERERTMARQTRLANAIDAEGQKITLARDGGIWVEDRFWEEETRRNAARFVALPLRPASPDEEQYGITDDVDDIMKALGLDTPAVILGPTGLETGPGWAALESEGEANLQRAMDESRAHERSEN